MSACRLLRSQLASIMEALAHAAVAEICQLLDEGLEGLRLEVSRCRTENLELKSRLRLMGGRRHGGPPHNGGPPLVPWTGTDHHLGEKHDPANQEVTVRAEPSDQELTIWAETTDQEVMEKVEPADQEVTVRAELEELEVLMVKEEEEEEEGTSCILLQEVEMAAGISGAVPPADSASCPGAVPPADSASCPGAVPPANSASRPGRSKQQGAGPSGLMRTRAASVCSEDGLPSEQSAAGRTGAVRPGAGPPWSLALGTPGPPVWLGGEAAQTDPGGPDSCSFRDLFFSPEVPPPPSPPDRRRSFQDEPLRRPFPAGSGAKRAFSCQQCGHLCSTSRDLLVHQRSHAGERVCHCHVCGKPFLHRHQLKSHQRVHTGERPYGCPQCGKRFSQSSHINRHMSVHTGEKRYSCSQCGKRFAQACSLKVHRAVHTGERPYSCLQCGRSFSVLGNLVRHQSIHIGK